MKLLLDDDEALALGRSMREDGEAMRNRRAIAALALTATSPSGAMPSSASAA